MKAEQLRKSILQLAIQGKLVKQDPNDEPASVLLEQIRAEKQRLIKEGKIKKDKGDSIIFKGDDNCYYEKIGKEVVCIDEEINFDLPDGWEYIRLSQIAYLGSGFTPSASELSPNGCIPYFKVSDMNTIGNEKYISITQQYYIGEKIKKVFPKNTIIFPKNGGAVFTNKKRILSQDSIVDLNTGAFIPYGLIDVEYAYILFSTIDFREHYKGTALPTINTEFMDKLIFGLPPIDEQKRIVKAVEEIAPLIKEYNRLESQATKLDGEIYDKLKKSILQYAIQGKLVEQDENDEPASVLLEHIRTEKKAQLGKKYVESYIYKGDDNCYYEHIGGKDINITGEIPFELPENWCWLRLGNTFQLINGDRGKNYPSKDKLKEKGDYPFISAINMSAHTVKTEGLLFLSKLQYDLLGSGKLKKDDFVFCLRGSLGKFCKYPYENGAIASSLVILRKEIPLLDDYIETYLSSFLIDEQIHNSNNGTAQPNLGARDIAKYLIPIPSLAEQKRIVDKLNEIFAKL